MKTGKRKGIDGDKFINDIGVKIQRPQTTFKNGYLQENMMESEGIVKACSMLASMSLKYKFTTEPSNT